MNNAPFSDEEVLAELLSSFPSALESKFREGMKKYASPLTAKNCLDEAFPEVMDLVVYLTAERMKRDKLYDVLSCVKELLESGFEEAALESLEEAIGLIAPRPLAVKVSHKTSSPEATS